MWTNVVSCDDLHIILRDGTTIRKSLCAKVELLSVMDAPTCIGGFRDFTKPLVEEFCSENGFTAGLECIDIGKKANFEKLDLLTHI
jgi:hypothetical protein